jgi:hypothetical protein
MTMIDAQTVRGGRAGPTFHNAGGRGGRTIGTERTILVEILGLPIGVRVDAAKPHDVRVGRKLLRKHLADFPRLQAIVADRGYKGLAKLASRRQLKLGIKAKPVGTVGLTPIGRSGGSSTPSPSAAAGAACRAATWQRGKRQGAARGFVHGLPTRPHLTTRPSSRSRSAVPIPRRTPSRRPRSAGGTHRSGAVIAGPLPELPPGFGPS